MSLCSNCYHNKVCEYKSCDKEDCLHYKNENLVYELSLELGTPYYKIDSVYVCDYDKECEISICCNTCPYNKEKLIVVRYAYHPTLFSGYESLGKFYLSKEEAEKELERLNSRQENKND